MKKWIIALTLLVALGAAGFWYVQTQAATRQITRQSLALNLETATVQTGSLDISVDAVGNVRPAQSATLVWQTTGRVAEVLVQPGDKVKAGQVVARLATDSLPQSLVGAQADLITARQNLQDYRDSFSALAISQAQKAAADAQKTVEDKTYNLSALQNPAKQSDIDQAYANMVIAEERLDKARKDFAPYANKPATDLRRASLQNSLSQAQSTYDSAVSKYNNLTGHASNTTLSIAQAELDVAQQQLLDAQAEVARLQAGPDPDQIAVYEAKIAALEVSLSQASLTAPFDATVTEVAAQPGDLIKSGDTALRLDNLQTLLLDVSITEMDVPLVQMGQPVQLTFDALPGREYHGEVNAVGMIGSTSQNVVNFTVTILVTDADEHIRAGMSAEATIQVNQLTDVLLVPNLALQVQNGQQVVYRVGAQGVPQAIPVTLGVMGQDFSQISAGELQAGDTVALNYDPSAVESAAAGGGFMMFGPARVPGAGAPPEGGNR